MTRLELSTHMAQFQEMEALQQTGLAPIARINHAIALMQVPLGESIDRLRATILPETADAGILQNDTAVNAIMARVLKDALFALDADTSFLQNVATISNAQSDAMVGPIVTKVFERWWEKQRHSREFIRECDAPAAAALYQRSRELPYELLSPYIERINALFNLRHPETFERVRSARYVDLNADTFPEHRAGIHASYEKHWLKPSVIERLASKDKGEIEEFRRETRKGIFVFHIDETINGRPSVAEQMDRDFGRTYGQREARYRGACLVDEHNEVLSWLTYWQTPKHPSKAGNKSMFDYLHRGVTGHSMDYFGKPTKKEFIQRWDTIQLFDTICGSLPMASSRLFAKSLQEMMRENPGLQEFIAYRLFELFMDPSYESFGTRPIRFAENISSAHFFDRRGCREFALDFNAKGPRSHRQVHDMQLTLNPMWVAFSGEMETLLIESWAAWKAMQFRYGDITDDECDPLIIKIPEMMKSVHRHVA